MLSFSNDYCQGVHPQLLKALVETNDEALSGYCFDDYCLRASSKIRIACSAPNADVFFFVGGTMANKVVISSLLRENEGVISATTGHINTHEAGAIESTGHKVLAIPNEEAKIRAADLEAYIFDYEGDLNSFQMVKPALVYLSQPTELGTLYSRAELLAIKDVCVKHGLKLYMDGARLGYALVCPDSDLSLSDISQCCDVFYIGGTKAGAICGEAVVFGKGDAPKRFTSIMKMHGGLLAKGRLLGVQFDCLFTDSLYIRICENALLSARLIGKAFVDNGFELLSSVQTNQVFVILKKEVAKRLGEKVQYRFWYRYDASSIVARFVTSWATKDSDVLELQGIIKSINE